MSNLVPLYIDKTNGNIVATTDFSGGGGTPSGNVIGYTHTQLTVSNVWTVLHNKNTRGVVYQVYSGSMEHVHPDFMTIDNENQITIHFETPMAGLAHLILFTPV